MEDSNVKVLIVEDSSSAALTLAKILETFDVVGIARNGADALRMQAELSPDVITMDVNLPDADGLELTRRILAERDVSIIIISSLVSPENQTMAFEALRDGAYDLVAKSKLIGPEGPTLASKRLVWLVKAAAAARRRGATAPKPRIVREEIEAMKTDAFRVPIDRFQGRTIAAIGASTGGPAALREILSALPSDFPLPIVVAQHMPPGFTEGLVRWLDGASAIKVKICVDGERLEKGTAYFAPSGRSISFIDESTIMLTQCVGDAPCPSVNSLFNSVARFHGPGAICILLTGMGDDGAKAMLAAREAGALTLAQDEQSSVVFGMPKAAITIGAAEAVLPAGEIAAWLVKAARR